MTSLYSESHEQDSFLLMSSLFAYIQCKGFRRKSYGEDSEKQGVVSSPSPHCRAGSEFIFGFADSKNEKANTLG